MSVQYHALARQEIIETAMHYAGVRPDLGDAFLAELAASIDRISTNPLQFEQARREVRRCMLNRFPYGIYFRLADADTVRIIVVKHHRRRPGFGMRRT